MQLEIFSEYTTSTCFVSAKKYEGRTLTMRPEKFILSWELIALDVHVIIRGKIKREDSFVGISFLKYLYFLSLPRYI